MGNIALHLEKIMRGWTSAVLSFRENPLHNYWTIAGKRNVARRRWWQRSPGLLFWGALISLALTAYFVYIAWWMLTTDLGASSRFQISTKLTVAISLLTFGGLLFSLLWLLARLFAIAQLALGFLEIEPRQSMRQTLDDMLVVTVLSEQEVLVGIGAHCLKLVAPPLVMLSAAIGVAAVMHQMQSGFSTNDGLGGSLSTIVFVAIAFLRLVLHGLLATAALTFMLVCLGLCQRSGVLPSIGATTQVVMQVLLSLGGAVLMVSQIALDFDGNTFAPAIAVLASMLLLTVLIFYLARRLQGIRNALAYAMPFVMVLVGLGIYADTTLQGLLMATEFMIGNTVWVLQSISVVSAFHLVEVFGVIEGFSYPDNSGFNEWWRYWLMLVLQLSLVVIFAEFARDAIRRRMWGAGKT